MSTDIRTRGMRRAEEWITKERKATLVLTGALQTKGVLWGDEAERIVSENLTQVPLMRPPPLGPGRCNIK